MNHVSVSPTDGNGPTQGQRKTLTRVGIKPTTFGLTQLIYLGRVQNVRNFLHRFVLVKWVELHSVFMAECLVLMVCLSWDMDTRGLFICGIRQCVRYVLYVI